MDGRNCGVRFIKLMLELGALGSLLVSHYLPRPTQLDDFLCSSDNKVGQTLTTRDNFRKGPNRKNDYS
jgi:hypothetical protein